MLLSSLQLNMAEATVEFMTKTESRILRLLDGVARSADWGMNILVVFDDQDAYYRYVSHFYPESGEFALSGGMHINAGCGHFVTVKDDLHAIEPVIVHEMVHGLVSHLPIPAWLNEGVPLLKLKDHLDEREALTAPKTDKAEPAAPSPTAN